MATIKISIDEIESHLAQNDSIRITSFSWGQNGYRSEPDIEWEMDGDVPDLEFDDDDFVESEVHNDLKREYEALEKELTDTQIKLDEVQDKFVELSTKYQELVEQTKSLSEQLSKPFWKFW